MLEESIESGSTVKKLVGKLDRKIKEVIEQGEGALGKDFPDDLVKNLLYYAAQAQSTDPAVTEVQESYALAPCPARKYCVRCRTISRRRAWRSSTPCMAPSKKTCSRSRMGWIFICAEPGIG